MIKDEKGLYFASSKITGERQLTATIRNTDWRHFPVGSRVKAVSNEGMEIMRKVISMGNGRQRVITIPKQDQDIFEKGETVRIYPVKQPDTNK
ncbi:MAG: hypothetical protein GY861_17185 [bacterium]|nr:hypothetical protein [bacterium]